MHIDTALITYLEGLARLRLSDTEREPMQGDLAAILGYMERLMALDTDGAWSSRTLSPTGTACAPTRSFPPRRGRISLPGLRSKKTGTSRCPKP